MSSSEIAYRQLPSLRRRTTLMPSARDHERRVARLDDALRVREVAALALPHRRGQATRSARRRALRRAPAPSTAPSSNSCASAAASRTTKASSSSVSSSSGVRAPARASRMPQARRRARPPSIPESWYFAGGARRAYDAPHERVRAGSAPLDRIADLAGARSRRRDLLARGRPRSLTPLVPHYMAPCWYTLDPASLLVTSHFNPAMPELPPEWLALEYYGDDVHDLAERRAHRRPGVSTLHEATGGDPSRSPRWQANMEMGGDQELLRRPAHARGRPVGEPRPLPRARRAAVQRRRDRASCAGGAVPRRRSAARAAARRGARSRRARTRPACSCSRRSGRSSPPRRASSAGWPTCPAATGTPAACPPPRCRSPSARCARRRARTRPGEVALARVLSRLGHVGRAPRRDARRRRRRRAWR